MNTSVEMMSNKLIILSGLNFIKYINGLKKDPETDKPDEEVKCDKHS